MMPQSFLSRRLFLQAGAVAAGGSVLAACTAPQDPSFIHEPLPAPSPPAKMERLLLWLPPTDDRLDGKSVAARFVKALEPYGVTVETGRSTRLEVDRGADQRAVIATFRPTYRLEIDIPEGYTVTRGATVTTSYLVVGVLYPGASRTPLARFHYHARAKYIPRFVEQVVEKLKAGAYL